MKDSEGISSLSKTTIDVPAMYGDHHVVELRRILFEIPGIVDVYASSAFHVVEVTFIPDTVSEDSIKAKLTAAGYLDEFTFPVEANSAVDRQDGQAGFFRHTAVYEQTRQAVSFGQVVSYLGRPLWNCPGMGVIKRMEE